MNQILEEIKSKIVGDRLIMSRILTEEITNIHIENVDGIANVTHILHDTSIIICFQGMYFKCTNPYIKNGGVTDIRFENPKMVAINIPNGEKISFNNTMEYNLRLLNNNEYPPARVIYINRLNFDLTPLEMAELKEKYYNEYKNQHKKNIPLFIKIK